MAIRDGRELAALRFVKKLVVKKKHMPALNVVFLMALMAGMDTLTMAIIEKGFPRNMNHPIFGVHSKHQKSIFPTYFLLAISQGNMALIKQMISVNIAI